MQNRVSSYGRGRCRGGRRRSPGQPGRDRPQRRRKSFHEADCADETDESEPMKALTQVTGWYLALPPLGSEEPGMTPGGLKVSS